jgi:hypothetical protein
MWWGMRRGESDYDYSALGNRGQFIYISPHKKLIIVRHGETYVEFGGAHGWLNIFYDFAGNIEAGS